GTRRGRHGRVDRGSDPVGLRAGPEAGEEAGGPPGGVRCGGALLRPRLLWVRGSGPWKGRRGTASGSGSSLGLVVGVPASWLAGRALPRGRRSRRAQLRAG